MSKPNKSSKKNIPNKSKGINNSKRILDIKEPFYVRDFVYKNRFNLLSDSPKGLTYLLYFTTTTDKPIHIDPKSETILSNECTQYYAYLGRTIIGSFFITRTAKTKCFPHKVIIGSSVDSSVGTFSCVTSPIDKGGIIVFKDSRSNLLLITVDISFSPFVTEDP